MKYHYYCIFISCWWRQYSNKSNLMQWRHNVIMTSLYPVMSSCRN